MNFAEELCLAWTVGIFMGGIFLCLICSWVHRSDSPTYENLDDHQATYP